MEPWGVYVTEGYLILKDIMLSKCAPWEVAELEKVGWVGPDVELLMVHQVQYKSSPWREQW